MSTLLTAFLLGGLGMYPILVTGLIIIVASIRYALDGEPIRLRFIATTAIAMVAMMMFWTLCDVVVMLRGMNVAPLAGDKKKAPAADPFAGRPIGNADAAVPAAPTDELDAAGAGDGAPGALDDGGVIGENQFRHHDGDRRVGVEGGAEFGEPEGSADGDVVVEEDEDGGFGAGDSLVSPGAGPEVAGVLEEGEVAAGAAAGALGPAHDLFGVVGGTVVDQREVPAGVAGGEKTLETPPGVLGLIEGEDDDGNHKSP